MKVKFIIKCLDENKKERPTKKEIELLLGVFQWMGYKFNHVLVELEGQNESSNM